MIFQTYALAAVILLAISSLVLLIDLNSRVNLVALSVQYVGVFWLVAISWPLGLSTVKLIVGLMAVAILSASHPSTGLVDTPYAGLSGRIFHGLAAAIVWIAVLSVGPALQPWFPINPDILQGGILLIGMGLLQLGMTTNLLRVFLGLLTTLSGFEIIYSALETSVLVTGLLALVNLGIAFVGAYLLTAPWSDANSTSETDRPEINQEIQ
jgi:hypothetical protein